MEAGEFLFDLAANLYFQFQFAVGMAGFLRQALGVIKGFLGLVAGAFELLLAGLHARQHGVKGIGQMADFVPVFRCCPQGVVLVSRHLPGQGFQVADRAGDQTTNLPGHQRP